jgi:hypothetical protein
MWFVQSLYAQQHSFNYYKFMRKTSYVAIALFVMQFISSCGASNSLKVKSSDFGDEWMLTVNEGELKCEGGAISFTANGTAYAVNGTAKGKGYADISSIWKAGTPPVPKKSISPLIDKGKTLC